MNTCRRALTSGVSGIYCFIYIIVINLAFGAINTAYYMGGPIYLIHMYAINT